MTTENKNTPRRGPLKAIILSLADVLEDMGMVMVKTDDLYQTMYKNEEISKKGKIISFSEIIEDREAVRELLSVATDLLFDAIWSE